VLPTFCFEEEEADDERGVTSLEPGRTSLVRGFLPSPVVTWVDLLLWSNVLWTSLDDLRLFVGVTSGVGCKEVRVVGEPPGTGVLDLESDLNEALRKINHVSH
jgi:hypothetical protein